MAAASSTARSALVMLALVACKRDKESPPAPIAKDTAALAAMPFFRVDATPLTPCKTGQACEAKLALTALGDYHVNTEYPFKFVADANSEVAVEGTGILTILDEQRATMTVRFTPQKAGAAKLIGAFKLSVCNEENCQIESPTITLDVVGS